MGNRVEHYGNLPLDKHEDINMSHSVISAANAGSKSKSIVKYLKKKGVSVNDSLIREALSSALGFRTSNEMVAIGN